MKKIVALILALMMIFAACAFAEESGRTPAPYTFILNDGEDQYYENLIFYGDVIVSGENASIFFFNCEFSGDIINTSEAGNKLFLLGGCEVSGQCIIRNSTQETTVEAPFPKFISDAALNVVTEDCFGAAIVVGDVPITFNGQEYTLSDAEFFYDENAGFVPYEGQEANVLVICEWWENGEKTMMIECEFDPTA